MKEIKYFFYLFNKFKKVLFFFSFLFKLLNFIQYIEFDNYYNISLNEKMDDNDNNNNNKTANKNMLITLIQVTYPFRKVCYGLIGIIIINTFFDDINTEMVLTIITTIDVIDRAIVEGLNEMDEIDSNKNSESIDNKEKDK